MVKRSFAFLRAINVGGHVVKMELLRGLFQSLGLQGVETFIASGNVIFEASDEPEADLVSRIELLLQDKLGYAVAVFIRSEQELAAIAAYQPFPLPLVETAHSFNVAFLSKAPEEAAVEKLMGLQTDVDAFRVHEREIYWLIQKRQSESVVSNVVMEKAIGMRATTRGLNTIRKLEEKYGSSR